MASTIFILDYILTFRMEVDLVWKSKWNFMKGLYLFQRYLPFIGSVWLVLYCQSDVSPILLCSFFLGQTGAILTETACWRVYYATGGS